MANNRLYLVDLASGDSVMFAKSLGSGWCSWAPEGENVEAWLDAWLAEHDIAGACGQPSQLAVLDEDAWLRFRREHPDGEHTTKDRAG
jgi:hypothetical protein